MNEWTKIQNEYELLEWIENLDAIGVGYVVLILKQPHPIERLDVRQVGEDFGIVIDIIKDYKIQWN